MQVSVHTFLSARLCIYVCTWVYVYVHGHVCICRRVHVCVVEQNTNHVYLKSFLKCSEQNRGSHGQHHIQHKEKVTNIPMIVNKLSHTNLNFTQQLRKPSSWKEHALHRKFLM